jgi:hypothetical protein
MQEDEEDRIIRQAGTRKRQKHSTGRIPMKTGTFSRQEHEEDRNIRQA